MKRIINIFLVTLLLIALTGCRTKEKTVRTKVEEVDVLDSIRESIDYTKQTWSIEEYFSELYKADRVGHLVIYDTEKPVDSITGKPPIKLEADFVETVQNNKTQKRDSVRINEGARIEAVQVRDSTETRIEQETVVEVMPWYRKTPFKRAVFLLTLAVGLLAAIKLNVHKILLKWLANIF